MRQLWKCWLGMVLAFAAFFSVSMGFLNPAVFAQTAVTGGLNGVVADPTGAVVPGATVTLVETNTGDKRVLTTNGLYTAPFLKPGDYTVSASANGLQSNTIEHAIQSDARHRI